MSEWTHTRIRDLLETSYAGDWGAPPSPGNARILRATDIDSDGRVTGNGALRQISLATLQEKSLKKGDILLEASGGSPEKPVGRVAFFYGDECPIPSLTSNFFKTLRPAKSTSARFIHWALLRFYRQPDLLQYQQQTTGIINLKFQDYLDAILHIPCSKKEQRLIARILDTLDTQIEKTEVLIAKLEKVKEGLLHDLLTRGIDENGQLRLSPEQAPELYKESPLGLIPREWSLSSVGQEFEIQLGKMLDAERNSGEIKPYLGNKSVQWGNINLNEVGQVKLTASDIVKFRLAPGDLLVCEGGEVGRAALWKGQMEECYYQKALHRLREKKDLSPRFMLQVLFLWGERNTLSDYASQTSIAHLPKEKLAIVPIPVPSKHEQKKITNALQSHELTLKAETEALSEMHKIKFGLMDDLLTSRIRVTPLLEQLNAATSA